MINYTTITTELLTLVGFRSTSSITLSTSLETSDSGLYVNALPDVSLEYIQDASVQDKAETKSSGVLTVGNWYKILDVSGGADFTGVGAASNTVDLLFEATGTTPTWGTGSVSTQPTIDYLNLVRTDEIQNILKQFVTKLQHNLNVQEVKVNDKLIKQFGTVKKSQTERARGFYFKLANSKTLKMVMKSISLQLDAVDNVRLYLYEVGKSAAIFQHDYTSKNNEIDFETLTGWEANYQDTTNIGKEYLLLYYDYDSDNVQSAIQLESATKYYVSSRDCFKSIHNNYVFFEPVEFPKSYWNWNSGTSQYDIPNLENTTALSFCSSNEVGLNLDYNITCDITQLLIDNKAILARMLQYAYAERILNDAITSKRINASKREVDKTAPDYAGKYSHMLNGGEIPVAGGTQMIPGEIDRVVDNFKNIDCKCFYKNNIGVTISNTYQANINIK